MKFVGTVSSIDAKSGYYEFVRLVVQSADGRGEFKFSVEQKREEGRVFGYPSIGDAVEVSW